MLDFFHNRNINKRARTLDIILVFSAVAGWLCVFTSSCGHSVCIFSTCSFYLPNYHYTSMEDLINKTLNNLKDSGNMATLKTTFRIFLEGMRALSSENTNLKEDIQQKSSKILALETQVKSLMDEKVDIANSLEFNAAAIKDCETSLVKIADLEKKLEEATNSKALLNEKISSLEDKVDATDAYERRDCVILSGAVPPVSPNENTRQVTVDIINAKYRNLNISPNDISVCHRLQAKRPSPNGSRNPPNIYVKFVRRDTKRELIKASKGQARDAQNKLFANESLTPKRTAILQTLLKIKKNNNTIKGVTSEEGQVFAFTAPPDGTNTTSDAGGRQKDRRHSINSKAELQKFCDSFLRRQLEDFIDSWPPTRQQ